MTNVQKGLIAVLVLSSLFLLAGCSHETVAPEGSDDTVTEEVTNDTAMPSVDAVEVVPTPAPSEEPAVVPGTETVTDGTAPAVDSGTTPVPAEVPAPATTPMPAETPAQ